MKNRFGNTIKLRTLLTKSELFYIFPRSRVYITSWYFYIKHNIRNFLIFFDNKNSCLKGLSTVSTIYIYFLTLIIYFWIRVVGTSSRIQNKNEISINQAILCLSGCLLVCIKSTSIRLNRSGPNVLWDLT